MGGVSTSDNLWAVKEERQDGNKDRDDANDTKSRRIINAQGNLDKRLFMRANHMGSWMSVQGTTVTGTLLTATQFCDFMRML